MTELYNFVGCADGMIRVLRFDPNRCLGILGRHKQPDTIERLAINHDDTILASIGLDPCIRLWDIQNLKILIEGESSDDDSSSDEESKRPAPSIENKIEKKRKRKQSIPNFFSDLDPSTNPK